MVKHLARDSGRRLGGRDHTTVLHAIRTVKDDTRDDTRIAEQINQLEGQILS